MRKLKLGDSDYFIEISTVSIAGSGVRPDVVFDVEGHGSRCMASFIFDSKEAAKVSEWFAKLSKELKRIEDPKRKSKKC